MVRTRGPLLSVNATGTLAKMLIHSSCRGTSYTKRHVIPHDPKTAKQMAGRAYMRWLTRNWAQVTTPQRNTWAALAESLNLPQYQAYLKHNATRWASFHGPTNAYPATDIQGDWAFDSLAVLGEVKQIKIDVYIYPEANVLAVALHRSAEGDPPTPINLVAIITGTGLEVVTWYDTNVIPGIEYTYRVTILEGTGHKSILNDWASGTALP